jgi:hypothetical protein
MTTSPQPEAPNWRRLHAFGLPEGSVRAVLAVAIFATIWVLLVRKPEQEVPDYLRDLLFIIMGHYFASRRRSSTAPSSGPGPLFLPKGTIRLILFSGFVAVGVLLFRGGHFSNPLGNPGVVTLMLVAGFLLGVVVSKIGDWWREKGHQVPRWIEDSRALFALLATAVLIFLVWNRFNMVFVARDAVLLHQQWDLHLGPYGTEHILGAIVGFYFGSRS